MTLRTLIAVFTFTAFSFLTARGESPSRGLEENRGIHPRLFLRQAEVLDLREKIKGTHKPLWEQLVRTANSLAKQTPTPYRNDVGEQIWQRDVGNAIATLAFTWLISGEKKYLDAATRWAVVSCRYPTWGIDPDTKKPREYGLVYGHQLFGLAMLYDYAFSDLSPENRQLIRTTLIERGSRAYEACRDHKFAYLQNHTWINGGGLMVAGLALYDDVPAAGDWVQFSRQILAKSSPMLSPDGASQEGFGYWEYGTEYLLKMMHLSRQFFGDNFSGLPWWKNTGSYALHFMIPRNAWTPNNSLVDLVDCVRHSWYGPDYQLRALAAFNRDGVAQWQADAVARAGVDCPSSTWLNLLWYDPAVLPVPPADKETFHHFDNMGIVCARSDWSGNESLVVFKCGAPLGRYAVEKYKEEIDPRDIGHVHPDAAHFTIFAEGEWLIRNLAYVKRQTEYHNTLLIDRKGQWGQQKGYFDPWPLDGKKFGVILRAESTPRIDWITGDATDAYPSETGIRRFIRHLIFVKPSVLIVADEIEFSQPRPFSLLFHPEYEPKLQPDGSLLANGNRSLFKMKVLAPSGINWKIGSQNVGARHPGRTHDSTASVVSLETTATQWRSAVALSWASVGQETADVTLSQQGNKWIFHALGQQAELNW